MRRGTLTVAALSLTAAALYATPVANANSTAEPEVACLAQGTIETVAYAKRGDGVLLVGDEFAQNILGDREGKSLLGGELSAVTDPDLNPSMLFDPKAEEGDVAVRARNSMATTSSTIAVAFRSGKDISQETISRVMLLAGERQVFWVAPVGSGRIQAESRTELAKARSTHENLTVVYAQTLMSPKTAQDPNRMTNAEGSATFRLFAIAMKLADRHRVVKVASACADVVDTTDPGQEMRAAALEFAQMVVNSPSAKYSGSTATSPYLNPYPYNCSTLVAAAYRYATEDAVQLVGFSDSQLWDTVNIELVPWSEAQPGDIFFQKTMDDRFTGHVGMLLDKPESGGGTVIHACGADGWCSGAPAQGMGYTDISVLSNSGGLAYVLDPSSSARQGNIGFTTDYTQAWFGRVVSAK